MMPYFLNNDLDNGILNGFNALINVIEENKIYTENSSEEYTDSGRGFFKASIFFSLCIFLLGTLLVLIEQHKYRKYKKIKEEIENMTYNEILNDYSKNNTKEIDDLYKNRLTYLAINKSIDEIKIDKDKFKNNRKILNTYEEIILNKQKQYISSLSEEELKYQYRNTNSLTEKKLYENEMYERNKLYAKNLSLEDLEEEIISSINYKKQKPFTEEYIERMRKQYEMYSLEDLLEELDIIENNTLNNKILNIPLIKDNLIMYLNKYISYQIRDLSSSDIKSNMNKADDFYYDLLEEELEEKNRRDSYTSSYGESSSSSSSYSSSFGSSSWESSSSSYGGFSGGGGRSF